MGKTMDFRTLKKEEAVEQYGVHYWGRDDNPYYEGDLMLTGPSQFFSMAAKVFPNDKIVVMEELGDAQSVRTGGWKDVFPTYEEALEHVKKEKRKNYGRAAGLMYRYSRDPMIQEVVSRVQRGEEKGENFVQFVADYERAMSRYPQLKQILATHSVMEPRFEVELNELDEELSVWFNIAAGVGDDVYILDVPKNMTEAEIRKAKITNLVPSKIGGLGWKTRLNGAYSFEAHFSPCGDVDDTCGTRQKVPLISGDTFFDIETDGETYRDAQSKTKDELGFVMNEKEDRDSYSVAFRTEVAAKRWLTNLAKEEVKFRRKQAKAIAAKFKP